MATKATIDRLSQRIDALAASLGVKRTANVMIWGDQTEAEALERHLATRPDDRVDTSFQFQHLRWMTRAEAAANGWV